MNEKRFVVLITLIFVITILSGALVIVFFYPSIQNVTVFDDFTIESEQLRKKNLELSEQLKTLRTEKEQLLSTQSISKKNLEELKYLEELAGIREVSGEGVIISLSDDQTGQNSLGSNTSICHGSNIRDIINILKIPELEVDGIAVNGVRIHPQTSINCFGDGVTVDTNKLYPPYHISVVGNDEKIINSLKTKTHAPELWKEIDNHTITLEMTRTNILKLPPTRTNPQMQFISPTPHENS